MTLVSVIIPVYNRGRTVRKAIESVLAQSYSKIEVIVIDDGSQDETVSVVKELARSASHIRLIEHGQKKGAQAARNTGIRAAGGEWIAFLDSDDYWLPYSLEVRLKAAMERQVQVVHSECLVVKDKRSAPQLYGVPPMSGAVYKELLQRPGPMFQSMLIQKEALARIGYLDETIKSFQEWDTSIRLARYFEFGFVPEPTFIYNCYQNDAISKDPLCTAEGYKQVFTKHRWPIAFYLGPRGLALHYATVSTLYRKAGYGAKARRYYFMSALLWPSPQRLIRGLKHFLNRKL